MKSGDRTTDGEGVFVRSIRRQLTAHVERTEVQFRLVKMMIDECTTLANAISEALTQEPTLGRAIRCQANVALPRVVLEVRQQIKPYMCNWTKGQREEIVRSLWMLANATDVAWTRALGAVRAILLRQNIQESG